MEKARILAIHGSIITEDGKKYNLYKSNIKAVIVVFGMESLVIEIINNNMENRLLLVMYKGEYIQLKIFLILNITFTSDNQN